MAVIADAQDVIEEVLRTRLRSADVQAVKLRPERDHDGDDILRVFVVISPASKLDPHELKGLTSRTRDALDGIGIDRFPMYTFLLPQDAADLDIGLD